MPEMVLTSLTLATLPVTGSWSQRGSPIPYNYSTIHADQNFSETLFLLIQQALLFISHYISIKSEIICYSQ